MGAVEQDVVVRLLIQSVNAPGAAASHNAAIEQVVANAKTSLSGLEAHSKAVGGKISSNIDTQIVAAAANAETALAKLVTDLKTAGVADSYFLKPENIAALRAEAQALGQTMSSEVQPTITRVSRDLQTLGSDGTAAVKSLTEENIALGASAAAAAPTIERMVREVSTGAKAAVTDAGAATSAVKGLTDAQVAGLSKVASAWQSRINTNHLDLQLMKDQEAAARRSLETDALVAESKLAISKLTKLTGATNVKAAQVEQEMAKETGVQITSLVEGFLGLNAGSLTAAAGLGTAAVALGVVLAAVLAVVVVFGTLIALTYKTATAFGEYGEKIHDLQQKVDISGESLATLTVIAKETNTDLDTLATTTNRLEVNISKGISKPSSEAGRALKLLHLDVKALATDSPEVALQKVGKAILGVNNASVQARAATALAGKGFTELKPALTDIVEKWDEAGRKANAFGLVLTQSQIDAADAFQDSLSDIELALQGFLVQAGSHVVPQLMGLMNDLGGGLKDNESLWVQWATNLGTNLEHALQWVRVFVAAVKADIAFLGTLLSTGNLGLAYSVGQSTYDTEAKRLRNEYLIQTAMDQVRDATDKALRGTRNNTDTSFPDAPSKAHKQLTEMQRLTKELVKTNAEIDALTRSTSQEFKLKFDLEDTQKFKSGLEEILKLRHEMQLPLRIELPGRDANGLLSDEARARAQDLLRLTKLQKQVYDEVTQAVLAQSTAEAKLTALREQMVLPVVDAITRADTKYAQGVIDRRNAEQELTADIISNARLRLDAERDYAGQVVKAYQTIRLEQGKTLDEIRAQRLQDEAAILALSGGESSLDAATRQRIGSTASRPVPTELQQVAAAAGRLDANVNRIAIKIVGAGAPDAAGTGASNNANVPPSAGGLLFNPEVSAARRNNVPAGQEGIVSLVEWESATEAAADYGIEVEKVTTQTQEMSYAEGVVAIAREKADGERVTRSRLIKETLLQNEGILQAGLVSFEDDLAAMRSDKQVARMHEERTTALSIKSLEDDLFDIESGNEHALTRLRSNAVQDRLSQHLALKQHIVNLEDEIAHAGEDSADREREAYLSAVRDIQRAHEDAAASIIRSQVEIQQQTVYSADIADAKVLEFLAHQKGITDSIADAKIGVISTTFDLISSGLDRAFAKLGAVGRLISSIISDLLKPALTSFFAKLFGLSTQGQQGPGGLLNLASAFAPTSGLRASNTAGGLSFAAANNPVTGGVNFQSLINRAAPNPFAAFGSNTAAPGFLPTIAQQQLQTDIAQTIATSAVGGGIHEAGHAAGQAASGAATGLTGSFAAMLPALGLGVGAQLGGAFFQNSRAANLIGTVAGGALGLSAGLAGFLALGGSLGSGALAGAGAAIAGALPIIAPIAVAALIAAYFINRSALRRKEEDLRSQILIKARNDIDAIIAQVKAGRLDGTSAIAQALAIRQQYLTDVGQLKDSKTRNIAIATVRELDARISTLRTEALRADRAADIDNALIPTFRNGGDAITAFADGGSWRTTQGGPSGVDYIVAMLGNDETVITPQTRAALGGDRAMRRANVRGYNDGLSPRPSSNRSSSGGSGQGAPPVIKAAFFMVPDEETANALIKSSAPDVIAQKVRVHIKTSGSTGLVSDIFEAADNA